MQSKFWCFTLNNPDVQLQFNSDRVCFAVWQLERGEREGTLHFQGYLEFKSKCRLAAARAAVGGNPHLEPRRGSQSDCIAYCSKEGTRVAGPWRFGEPSRDAGLKPFLESLRSGATLRDAAVDDPDTYCRHRSALRDYSSWLEPRAWREVSCFYLCGDTGTGKSALVYDSFGYDNVYALSSQAPLWFDGYSGQRVLFIDEFAGTIDRETLLRILDGHPFSAPVKGDFVNARWTVVVCCANNDFFAGFDPALRRRFERGGFHRVVGQRGDPGHQRLAALLRGALGRGGGVPVVEAGAGGGEAGVAPPVGLAGGVVGDGVPPGPVNYVGNLGWVLANA